MIGRILASVTFAVWCHACWLFYVMLVGYIVLCGKKTLLVL